MSQQSHQAQHDDWDQHWEQYAGTAESNPAQSYRRRLLFQHLEPLAPGARLLDIGSGQGDFAVDLLRQKPGVELLGLELSRTGVEISRRKAPAGTFLERNLLDGGRPRDEEYRGWATHAVCSEVLEHVDEPAKLLQAARHYLAGGSRLVVTVPGGPMSAFDKHIGHRTHYTPDSLRALLKDAGFTVELATGAGFPFFNLYRMVVIARGQKLVDDVARGEHQAATGAAARAMATFDWLFRFNRDHSALGWQMLAVARAE